MSPILFLLGVALGGIYTLSPTFAWATFAACLIIGWTLRPLAGVERRLVLVLFVVALLSRFAIIAVLFTTTDHDAQSFASLFGDEEYFKYRSIWLRSLALGVPIHRADIIYAFSEYSETNYLYVLGFLQVLMGEAPYGVHLFGITLHLAGVAVLFRLVRDAYGPPVALLTSVGVLFLPSLFAWSLSALRESFHFFFTMGALAGSVALVQGRTVARRVLGAVALTAALLVLRDLRAGSMMATALAIVTAGALVPILARARRAFVVTAVATIMVMVALSVPAVQDGVLQRLRGLAYQHHGHVFTPGYSYRVLDGHYYFARAEGATAKMTWPEAGRYVVRAVAAAVFEPVPWHARSRFELAYIPEQMVWYVILALAAVGLPVTWRINRYVTLLFVAYCATIGAGLALTSGNIGTLVRHRGLVLPFMICFAAAALCRLLTPQSAYAASQVPHLPPPERTAVICP